MWQQIASAKRAARDESVAKYMCNRAAGQTVDNITSIADIDLLRHKLETGELSAEAVTLAYIESACQAQIKTNCLTETRFDEALSDARRLDDHRRIHGELVGPLHGVPVSLKDQFDVEGLDSTLGYVGRAFHPAVADACVVKALKWLGAVVFTKTNLPQSIMWCETENPLWGLTTHPMNKDFTPGGSSGGEGALLSCEGSLLGWGTDIGGSVRIPCHMNGLWGLKPTSKRMSYNGVPVSTEGQEHVPSAIGPMARSLSSLTIATKAIIQTEPWNSDPALPPLSWKLDVWKEYSERPLVFGLMLDDGVVRVHPPMERVFRDLVKKLQDTGHETVEWDTTLNPQCIAIMDEYYTSDGGEDIRKAITQGGEPFVPHVEALINRAPAISVYEYWQINKRKVAAQQAYHDMWNEAKSASGHPVDVILAPTMPHTAVPHRECRWVGYTKLFNLLDYPALSFPAGKVSRTLDSELPKDYHPRNAADAWNWARYKPDLTDGYHVGLQIIGRRFEEEKVLGVASQLERLLRQP